MRVLAMAIAAALVASTVTAQRKAVTVLFCDLVGSTALAERLGPDLMHDLLSRFFELALAEVHRYEGTVNQFLGSKNWTSARCAERSLSFFATGTGSSVIGSRPVWYMQVATSIGAGMKSCTWRGR